MQARIVGGRARQWIAACLLVCGASAASAAALVVGQVAPMTGVEATQGRGYAAGLKLVFDQVNAAGGIAGNTLVLSSRDDGSRAADTLTATRDLVEKQRPIALAGYFGAQPIGELIASGLLERERLPLVGFRGAMVAANTPYVYNVRAGWPEQIDRIVRHVATFGITRLGVLYEDGTQLAATRALVEKTAAQHKVQLAGDAVVPAGSNRVGPAVEALAKAQPQAILILASSACSAFVEAYRAAGGGAQLFATAEVDVEQLSKRLGEDQLKGISIAQVTPSPNRLASRITRDFQQAVKAVPPDQPVSHAMFEGYIAGRVLAEAIRRAGPAPNRETLTRALDGLDRLDLGDYVIGFRPGMHTGSRYVDLSIVGRDGLLRQ
ncbi:ABC transporter substrate-binding protein [uncultured Xylophilus sp.]|uniref:ABC transporter substrate-binding protein n=1 Tax=uncultured Xylophilus sp. TaxID=296832 RepID=UPI0025E57E1B|nr:ABC transporter substrate-binding protein [uncultured Xylophilus sp.]